MTMMDGHDVGQAQDWIAEGQVKNTEAGQAGRFGKADQAGYWDEAGDGDSGSVPDSDELGGDGESVPERYEFQVPEGQDLDEVVVEAYSEVAKELNLPQDQAQKVIDRVAPVIQQRQAQALARMQQEWTAASTVDQEFGGQRLHESLAVAKRAIEVFGTPELKVLLNESGLGNHPEVIRAFYRAGKVIGEDSIVNGAAFGKAKGESIEQRMYPNM